MSKIKDFFNRTKRKVKETVDKVKSFPDRLLEKAVHAILDSLPDALYEKLDDLVADVIERLKESYKGEISYSSVKSVLEIYERQLAQEAYMQIESFYNRHKELPDVPNIARRIPRAYPTRLKEKIVAEQREKFKNLHRS